MPPVSQQQRKAMYAAAEGHSNLGIPKSVGQEFVSAGKGVSGLPNRASGSAGSSSALEAMSGMRRGRHAKQAKAKKAGGHAAAHSAMNQAYAKGDFNGAKSHALNFANALHHALTSSNQTVAGNQPDQATDTMGGSVPPAQQNTGPNPGYTSGSSSGKARLAQTLSGLKRASM